MFQLDNLYICIVDHKKSKFCTVYVSNWCNIDSVLQFVCHTQFCRKFGRDSGLEFEPDIPGTHAGVDRTAYFRQVDDFNNNRIFNVDTDLMNNNLVDCKNIYEPRVGREIVANVKIFL